MKRPVLVTGGAGFIGRHLVSSLSAQGTRVRAVVRSAGDAQEVAALGAETLVGDLLDVEVVRRATAGVGGIYHLAGRLFAPGEPEDEYERLHVGVTRALVERALADNMDVFVHCSTTGVHGTTSGAPAREDDSAHPTNAYERTKAKAERVVIDLAQGARLKLAIVRPGLVYGPGDRHLLGWFRAIQRGVYRVIGRGDHHLHPIYIDDLIRGVLLAASSARAGGRTYHLVGSRPVTMRELSDAIGAAVGRHVPSMHLPRALAYTIGGALELLPVPRRALPLTRSRVRFMTQNRAYDGSRARDELGFVPSVELAEGLAQTVAWYRDRGWL